MLFTPDPIVAQLLLMKLGPVENQPKSPRWKIPPDEFQRLDPDLGFVVAVDGMEVRGRVIVIINANDDAKEDAECRYRGERLPYANHLESPLPTDPASNFLITSVVPVSRFTVRSGLSSAASFARASRYRSW